MDKIYLYSINNNSPLGIKFPLDSKFEIFTTWSDCGDPIEHYLKGSFKSEVYLDKNISFLFALPIYSYGCTCNDFKYFNSQIDQDVTYHGLKNQLIVKTIYKIKNKNNNESNEDDTEYEGTKATIDFDFECLKENEIGQNTIIDYGELYDKYFENSTIFSFDLYRIDEKEQNKDNKEDGDGEDEDDDDEEDDEYETNSDEEDDSEEYESDSNEEIEDSTNEEIEELEQKNGEKAIENIFPDNNILQECFLNKIQINLYKDVELNLF